MAAGWLIVGWLTAELLVAFFLGAIWIGEAWFGVDFGSEEMRGRDCPTGRARNLYTQISCLYNWTKNCIKNYNIFTFSRDVDSISGCSSQRTSSDSSLRELWCKVCNLILHERSSTASRVWPLQFFKLESSWLLGCLHSFRASSSLGEISPQMSYLSSLFIELRKEVFKEDSNFSSFEFKIKDNLSLIWFE